jgi:hypothetical protein
LFSVSIDSSQVLYNNFCQIVTFFLLWHQVLTN